MENSIYRINGRVIDRDTLQGIEGLRVEAWDSDLIIDDLVGSAVTNERGTFLIKFDKSYFSELFLDRRPDLYFKVFVGDVIIESTEDGVLWNVESGDRDITIEVRLPESVSPIKNINIEGKVASRSRAGVGGLRVVIVDKNVGDDNRIIETSTGGDGSYHIILETSALQKLGKRRPDLQAQAFTENTLLGVSDIHYNASEHETLNVLLPEEADAALPSEYDTLTEEISANYKGNLRDLKESDERQDITYLANKTGWDARAVAMAALADQFSVRASETEDGEIRPAFFYMLFRAGLPANESALYQADIKTVEGILKQGVDRGVIPESFGDEIPDLLVRFQKLAASHSLDAPALVGVSSLKDMLTVSLGGDGEKQKQFAEIYTQHRSDPQQLWLKIKDAFGETEAKRLQLDGQLGYLTLNNAPLIQRLHQEVEHDGITDPLDLVERGFYRGEKWESLLEEIPPEIPGKNHDERSSNYADLLAAQVQLSYPTAVVAQMVRNEETPLLSVDTKEAVHAFLHDHQGKFEIGMQPVEQYIARNALTLAAEVTSEIKRIQRIYQITPNDQAMNILLDKKTDLDSASAIVRKGRGEFLQDFSDRIGEGDAKLIYAKAEQVHNAVLNIALSYLGAAAGPAIGAGILDPQPQPPANATDVIAYSTLEGLLGEMDYCSCAHCRSILSPAAYLVDLLLFCDRQTNGGENPLDVLLSRRPDIEHLPLTCKNTHTPLPYIDVVNETLEYFIANQQNPFSLDGYTGHNTTAEVTPEELLTSPMFVVNSAYKTLAGEPAQAGDPEPLLPPTSPLPFHRPLEHLRRYFNRYETPLPTVMEALRKDDQLERAGPSEYGWRDILMEELCLSRAEYQRLTDRGLSLQQLYGYASTVPDADVLAALSKVKPFTQRLDITYEEIIEILQTRFVNPNATLIPKVEALGVSYATLQAFKEGSISDAAFDAGLAPGIGELEQYHYGGDIKSWVRDEENYKKIMTLITVVNPAAQLIRRLQSHGIPYVKLKELEDGTLTDAEFDTLVPAGFDAVLYGGDVKQWVRDNLSDAGDICSFDKLVFRYADPGKINDSIRAFEFVRLSRFIRLWKKLGWTIEQTDKAITALYPASQVPDHQDDAMNLQRLDVGMLTALPRLGVIKSVIEKLRLKLKRDLLPLLSCFAPIDTYGAASLYKQMFGSRSLLDQAKAFADNGFGEFLTDNAQKISDYSEALRGGFQLTADELTLITTALGYDAQTPLTVDNISAIFRRGWLARKLKLSVQEFLLLTTYQVSPLSSLTGLDPFAAPDPAEPPILRLIVLVDRLRSAALKPTEALYLIWDEDISGKSVPEHKIIRQYVRTLRADLTAIEADYTLVDDPDGKIARDKMAGVYGEEATNLFFGLLNNNFVTEVEYSHDQATLPQAILDKAPNRIAYDDTRKRLSYAGMMTTLARDTLKAGATAGFSVAVDDLYAENQKIVGPFFSQFPELQQLHDAYVFFGLLVSAIAYTHSQAALEDTIVNAVSGRIAYDNSSNQLSYTGVLTTDARDTLKTLAGVTPQFQMAIDDLYTANQNAIIQFFVQYPTLGPQQAAYLAANDSEERRRSVLLASFLPELKRRRKVQYALQSISAEAKTDISLASAILDDIAVLHAIGDNTVPALENVTAIETPGLSAEFFFRDTATGPSDLSSKAEAKLAYSANGDVRLPPNGSNPADAISGVWCGYLDTPENGFFNLQIEADAGATVSLALESADKTYERKIVFKAGGGTETWTADGQQIAQTPDGRTWRNDEAIEFYAGVLYVIRLTVEKVKEEFIVRWQTTGRGWEVIPAHHLYSASIVDELRTAYVRFLKASSLATSLRLTASEFSYFATLADYQSGGEAWMNRLPVSGRPDNATAADLFKVFHGLLDYARIKATLSPDDERLLTVIRDPTTATQAADSLLFTLTQWKSDSLNTLLTRFRKAVTDLSDLGIFCRVYDAYALGKQFRIPAASLIDAATNMPTADTLSALQSALRACYDTSGWLDVLKPINDEMRSLQRDALVAYILHQMGTSPASAHIDTPDKLFEYFLMDVGMDPCMQTSRIRHALSSVQLFIERCLINLEPRVVPSSIHAKQWQWMSRYRVWEANRKVFLYPENWLEPELRDDQSPFFKEVMSELLQSDITEDAAATALLNYLSKLDEVGKLEPCGIHYVENDTGVADDIAHVVARTAGANRKYYYRQKAGGSWTPWEAIKLDIEDNPVIPVVWKGRLFLFWLRIITEGTQAEGPPIGGSASTLASVNPVSINTAAPNVTIKAILCWSEYYNGTWQPTKTSDVNRPTKLGDFSPGSFERAKLLLSVSEQGDALRVSISGQGSSSFLLYNTHSLPVRREDLPDQVYLMYLSHRMRGLGTATDTFTITYEKPVPVLGGGWDSVTLTREVLKNEIEDSTTEPRHMLEDVWEAPFFYEDSRHVFYVTTAEAIVQVPEWVEYGITLSPGFTKMDSPPLVIKEDPRWLAEQDKRKEVPLGPDPGVVDPAPMELFLSEDAYINTVIGTKGAVTFGEVKIGPSGGLHEKLQKH